LPTYSGLGMCRGTLRSGLRVPAVTCVRVDAMPKSVRAGYYE
jgi:hypothetical protein